MSSTVEVRKDLRTMSWEQVDWLHRHGYVDDGEWDAYCHLWQTSAPRFGPRRCHCEACKKAYPSSEGY